jgi:protein-disulfide isomerase
MASREAEKRARRAEREAKEAQAAVLDRRSRRLKTLGAVLGFAAIVVVVAIVVSSSGGSGPSSSGGAQSGAPTGAAEVNARWANIPEKGLVAGNPKGPVTLVEFADLQCPFCRETAVNVWPTLIDKYVKSGRLRLEFRNFAIIGPDSEKAARAVDGAAAQNKAFPFLELWYLNQGQENSGYVTDAFIRRIASGVDGLDADKVVAAANDTTDTGSIGTAHTQASIYGINSTPAFLIGKTGSQPKLLQFSNPGGPAEFTSAIDSMLSGQ